MKKTVGGILCAVWVLMCLAATRVEFFLPSVAAMVLAAPLAYGVARGLTNMAMPYTVKPAARSAGGSRDNSGGRTLVTGALALVSYIGVIYLFLPFAASAFSGMRTYPGELVAWNSDASVPMSRHGTCTRVTAKFEVGDGHSRTARKCFRGYPAISVAPGSAVRVSTVDSPLGVVTLEISTGIDASTAAKVEALVQRAMTAQGKADQAAERAR